jgi:hypothetical protein
MTTNLVLTDYENVQPMELASLRGDSVRVKLFSDVNQSKIPVALAAALNVPDAGYVLPQ